MVCLLFMNVFCVAAVSLKFERRMDDFEEVWQQHKRTYTANSEELQSIIRIIPTIGNSQRQEYENQGKECLRNIERALTDLTQCLRQNRVASNKDQYKQHLNVYKQQLKSQRNNFQTALEKQRLNGYSKQDKEERQTLLQGNQILDSTQDALDRSKQVLAETEDIAIDTSDKVNVQGLQLENALANVNEINDTSKRARRIIVGMRRRMMTDRIIQTIIVVLELAIVGGLLYWKLS
eukprot:1017638_1